MPYIHEFIPNELFLEHNGVRIFHTYDDEYDEIQIYHFGTANDTSTIGDDTQFDVRQLPTWKEPEHPPYIEPGIDPKDYDALSRAWTQYFQDNIEETAIRSAIIAAIDAGLLRQYLDAANDRPKGIPSDLQIRQLTGQIPTENDKLLEATPGVWEIDTSSVNSISIWANSDRDDGILLATVHLEAGQDQAHANTKLMAHAKEMVAALIGCRNAMSVSGLWSNDEPFMERIDRILDKVLFD
jgi:hypothetical protein